MILVLNNTQGGFLISQIKQISGRIFEKILSQKNIDEFNGPQGRILYILWQEDSIPIKELSKKNRKRSEKNTGIQNDTDPRYLNSDRGTEIPVTAVVHGGTIMAVLSSLTGGEYFDFQVKNGEGYETVLEWIQGRWKITSLTKIGCADSKSEHLQ